jgi:TrpR-related protein YerC/YecD
MNKNVKGGKREPHMEMYEAILTLETLDECIRLFDDLCSVTELRAIEQRYQVARMLREGHIYSTILEKTGASSATISRVNRSLNYGKDGYEVVFKRLDEKKRNG